MEISTWLGLFILAIVWIKNTLSFRKERDKPLFAHLKKVFFTGILTPKNIQKQVLLGTLISLVVVSISTLYRGVTTEAFSIAKILYPLGEELIYRGALIGGIIYLAESITTQHKKLLSLILLLLSSVSFALIHPNIYPLYYLIGSIAFGVAYLWGWKRNLIASTTAHILSNLFILLLPGLVF